VAEKVWCKGPPRKLLPTNKHQDERDIAFIRHTRTHTPQTERERERERLTDQRRGLTTAASEADVVVSGLML
jgi:hypothetical protein